MPVTAEQVRLHIEAGLAELGTVAPMPDATVLLWAQQHPDGPDWAVSDDQFMRWTATLDAPQDLPTLSLAINLGDRAIEISARRNSRQTAHARTSRTVGATRHVTNSHVNVATASSRKETFRFSADGSDRNEIVAQAARRYVQLAGELFAAYAGEREPA